MFIKFAAFKKNEHLKIMNNMTEEEIIYDTVNNLRKNIWLESISFQKSYSNEYDYDLTINGITFACEVKCMSVDKSRINLILQHLYSKKNVINKPIILVVQHFTSTPELLNSIREMGISIAESSGNCLIIHRPLFINISGKKNVKLKESKNSTFNISGIKLVFYFLLNEGNINKPYRQISEETELSLGTIKNVITSLTKNNFVITTPDGRFIQNKKQLLDEWQVHYNRVLKPKLLVKEMEFVDKGTQKKWEHLTLPDGMCWGGEGAAYLLNHFMEPEQFDIYTKGPSINLLLTKKVKIQSGGRIKLYQKFWKFGQENNIAPIILIYADLIGSGDSRCIEAAQKIIKDEI